MKNQAFYLMCLDGWFKSMLRKVKRDGAFRWCGPTANRHFINTKNRNLKPRSFSQFAYGQCKLEKLHWRSILTRIGHFACTTCRERAKTSPILSSQNSSSVRKSRRKFVGFLFPHAMPLSMSKFRMSAVFLAFECVHINHPELQTLAQSAWDQGTGRQSS